MNLGQLYLVLQPLHYWVSRFGLVAAAIMAAIGIYVGIVRKRDVNPWFLRAVYTIAALMIFQALVGAIMYFIIGVRPYQEVHLIYGLASFLALPFFIFVERTAKKRPAMGSYIWGFVILAFILLRSILTGAAG